MTSKAELLKNRRRRIMLYGPKGTGKTSSLVAMARDYAAHGRVLYLDVGSEQGAVDDLATLPESVLENIDYRQPHSYKEIVATLAPGYVVVMVDALQNLRTISSEVATSALIAVGADKGDREGESGKGVLARLRAMDGIGHPSVLPFGKGLALQKEYERAFFDRLWDLGCDIICGCNTKSLTASENYVENLGGLFDVVVEMDRASLQSGQYEYRFTIDKVRGIDFTDGSSHTFAKGENVIKVVDELTRPKKELQMRCSVCNDNKPMSLAKDCMMKGHQVTPTQV